MTEKSIGTLVLAARQNDQMAINELYGRTSGKAYFVARRIMSDEDQIADILQESYIKAFSSLSMLSDPEKFQGWLDTIVINKCKDYLKKNKPLLFTELESGDEQDAPLEFEDTHMEFSPEASVDYSETKRLVGEMIDRLPEDQKMCLLLYYYEERSVNEIAEIMGCSANTVKSRLNYARKNIKGQVQDLEKKGTKLYCVPLVPFLYWFFRQSLVESLGGAAAAASTTAAAATAAAATTAETAAEGAAASAAAEAGTAAGTTTGTAAAGTAASGTAASGTAASGTAAAAGAGATAGTTAAGTAGATAAGTTGAAAAGTAGATAAGTAGAAAGATAAGTAAGATAAGTAGATVAAAAGTAGTAAAAAAVGRAAGFGAKKLMLAAALAATAGVGGTKVYQQVTETPARAVERFEDAYNDWDLDKMMECMDPEIQRQYRSVRGVAGLFGVDPADLFAGVLGINQLQDDGINLGTLDMEVLSVDYTDNSHATVTVEIVMGSGTPETETITMEKIDGTWYLME